MADETRSRKSTSEPHPAEGVGLEPTSPFGQRSPSPLTAVALHVRNLRGTPLLAGQKERQNLVTFPKTPDCFLTSDGLQTAHSHSRRCERLRFVASELSTETADSTEGRIRIPISLADPDPYSPGIEDAVPDQAHER